MLDDETDPANGAEQPNESKPQPPRQGFVQQQETTEEKQEPANEEQNPDSTPKPIFPIRMWQSLMRKWTNPYRPRGNFAEHLTVLVSVVIAVIAGFQYSVYRQQKKIMESSGGQTDQLIIAANINACAARQIADASKRNAKAAEGFAKSASDINIGVNAAVTKLWVQALATQASADAANTAAGTAAQQLKDSEILQSGRLQIEFDPKVLQQGDSFAFVKGDVTVINIGPTELTNVGALCTWWSGYKPPDRAGKNVEPTDFPNGGTIYPDKSPQTVCKYDQISPQWGQITKGKSFTGIMVGVSYRNIFGKLQSRTGCFMYKFRTAKFGPCPIPSNTPTYFP